MGMDYSKVFGVLKGSGGTFFYGIISKWYWLIAAAAMAVTLNVLWELNKKGILDKVYNDLSTNLSALEYYSRECPKEIGNFMAFFDCLSKPLPYYALPAPKDPTEVQNQLPAPSGSSSSGAQKQLPMP